MPNWITIVLLVCVIIQEIQIILLRRDINDTHLILAGILAGDIKEVVRIAVGDDDEEDE